MGLFSSIAYVLNIIQVRALDNIDIMLFFSSLSFLVYTAILTLKTRNILRDDANNLDIELSSHVTPVLEAITDKESGISNMNNKSEKQTLITQDNKPKPKRIKTRRR